MIIERIRLTVTTGAIGLTLLACAGVALADGDPASDYLISQDSFIPPDARATPTETTLLNGLLASSRKQGFPVKVAIIASRYDLGAVPILYGKPQVYAKFLASEDFYYWKAELVVVMPHGYGLFKAGGLPRGDRAVIAALPVPGTVPGQSLTAAAVLALRKLAARRGITLTVAKKNTPSSANHDRLLIVTGVAVSLATLLAAEVFRRRRARGRAKDPG